jgi:hypothetical protein
VEDARGCDSGFPSLISKSISIEITEIKDANAVGRLRDGAAARIVGS